MQQGKRRPARSADTRAPLAGYGSRVSGAGRAQGGLGAGAEERL
jgi:hypothetical protein